MDPLALVAVQNSIRSPSQRNSVNCLFHPLNPINLTGHVRRSFDVLKRDDKSLIGPYDLMYSLTYSVRKLDDNF
jgi:hypothetical protein